MTFVYLSLFSLTFFWISFNSFHRSISSDSLYAFFVTFCSFKPFFIRPFLDFMQLFSQQHIFRAWFLDLVFKLLSLDALYKIANVRLFPLVLFHWFKPSDTQIRLLDLSKENSFFGEWIWPIYLPDTGKRIAQSNWYTTPIYNSCKPWPSVWL